MARTNRKLGAVLAGARLRGSFVNIRGRTLRSRNHRDDRGDWGGGIPDAMAGVDDLITRASPIHEKLGLGGWS